MSLHAVLDPASQEALTPRRRPRSAATRLTVWIDRSPWQAFGWLSGLYVVTIVALSSFKLLWLDELITLHIARLPSVAAIWVALGKGADPNPPLTHILVHFCRLLFGEHELALRLPAALGYWVGLLALFCFLRRRVPAIWALTGVVLSMTMAAFDYSYESRSYGIFYGLAMLAFFCWSAGVDPSREPGQRRRALVGMTLALAAGISTNYFAVLAFLPIAIGEAIRLSLHIARRRYPQGDSSDLSQTLMPGRAANLRVPLALIVAATPLLAFRSMIAHSIAQFAPFAWNKVSWGQVEDSYMQMVEIVLYPLLALLVLGGVILAFGRLCPVCRARLRPRWFGTLAAQAHISKAAVTPYEAAGIFALMAYPILGYIVATVRGGMLSPRFVIPVCFGFAIAGTLMAYRLFGHMPGAGLFFLAFFVAWFISRESYVGYWYVEQKQSFYKVLDHLPEAERSVAASAPIVIPDPLLALTFQHYAPQGLSAREVFPVDFPAIRVYRGDDSPEENMWAGRHLIYTLPVLPLATFLQFASEYLVIAGDGNWLVQDLQHHHYPIERLPINTRAGAIGGFTPLARGVPAYYMATGDTLLDEAASSIVPFNPDAELPSARQTPEEVTSPHDGSR